MFIFIDYAHLWHFEISLLHTNWYLYPDSLPLNCPKYFMDLIPDWRQGRSFLYHKHKSVNWSHIYIQWIIQVNPISFPILLWLWQYYHHRHEYQWRFQGLGRIRYFRRHHCRFYHLLDSRVFYCHGKSLLLQIAAFEPSFSGMEIPC